MLQRTKAEQVEGVFIDFVEKYESPEQFLLCCRSNIFKNLGLSWRYRLYRKLCAQIVDLGKIPTDKKELTSLPGIGNYIAAAYRSLHLGQKDFMIDSNVMLLYGRYFGFQVYPETRREKWFIEFSESITPGKKFKEYNYALLDFTRFICKPKPLCSGCSLLKKCSFGMDKGAKGGLWRKVYLRAGETIGK